MTINLTFYFLCEHLSESEAVHGIYSAYLYGRNNEKSFKAEPWKAHYRLFIRSYCTPTRKNWTAPTDIFKLFGEAEAIAREVMFKPFTLIDVNQHIRRRLTISEIIRIIPICIKASTS